MSKEWWMDAKKVVLFRLAILEGMGPQDCNEEEKIMPMAGELNKIREFVSAISRISRFISNQQENP